MTFPSAAYRSSAFFTAGAHVFLTVCIIACGTGSLQAEAHDLHTLSNGARASHQHDSEHSLGTGDNNMIEPFTTSGAQKQYFNPHWLHEQLATYNSAATTEENNNVI